MAFVNLKTKEIQIKIVYYGPGRSGKTTNLEYIYENFGNRLKSKMITINTAGERTLFFDFFPFDIGEIAGFKTKIQLYTVPGQIKYTETRKLVINGIDGIVFVADAINSQRKHNILSLQDLQKNLRHYHKNIFKIPLVFQYNKFDLSNRGIPLLSVDTLERDLNRQLMRPSFKACAIEGTNVAATLKLIISMTSQSITSSLN